MSTALIVPLENIDKDYLDQVEYAITFLCEGVVSYKIDKDDRSVFIELKPGTDIEVTRESVNELLKRYQQTEFGLRSEIFLDQRRELPAIDAWAGLVERRWATPVGEGHVILRGPAAQLMALIDHKAEHVFGGEFHAELEIFPSTIKSETLHRCNHFTSFPEHMDFVAHLKPDLQVLADFSNGCRDKGWSTDLHEGKMSINDFAISPSCCYHAYEGMEGWDLEKPGRCLTAMIHCHRYEGANQKYMSRLRAFHMREVVFVGHPAFVTGNRARADEMIQQWAKDWELSCTFETANDMFFTDDFAIKASFQRQQQAKRELRLDVPSEKKSISVFSSNFHSNTFGKAFAITVAGRPATSGCIAWGLERWVYALFSQFGFDIDQWPPAMRDEYRQFTSREPGRDKN